MPVPKGNNKLLLRQRQNFLLFVKAMFAFPGDASLERTARTTPNRIPSGIRHPVIPHFPYFRVFRVKNHLLHLRHLLKIRHDSSCPFVFFGIAK